MGHSSSYIEIEYHSLMHKTPKAAKYLFKDTASGSYVEKWIPYYAHECGEDSVIVDKQFYDKEIATALTSSLKMFKDSTLMNLVVERVEEGKVTYTRQKSK